MQNNTISDTENFKVLWDNLDNNKIFEALNTILMESKKPSKYLNQLLEHGKIKLLFPELYDLVDCLQDEKHHPEGSVWNHTLLVVNEAARLKKHSKEPLTLMYVALLHDIGKPKTKEVHNDGKITFYGHAEEGVPIAKQFLQRLTNDEEFIQTVLNLIENHMHSHKLLEMKDTTVRRLMTTLDINDLMLFGEADELGRGYVLGQEDYPIKKVDMIKRIESLSNGSFGEIEPWYTASDLISLGYKSSKRITEMLGKAYEQQVDGMSKEHIKSFLENKITPKSKNFTPAEITDMITNDLVKANKKHHESAIRRVKWFKIVEDEQSKKENVPKFKRSENNVPYIEVINHDRTCKYLLSPIFALRLNLNNTKPDVLLSLHNTINERKTALRAISKDLPVRAYPHLRVLNEVYGSLSKMPK